MRALRGCPPLRSSFSLRSCNGRVPQDRHSPCMPVVLGDQRLSKARAPPLGFHVVPSLPHLALLGQLRFLSRNFLRSFFGCRHLPSSEQQRPCRVFDRADLERLVLPLNFPTAFTRWYSQTLYCHVFLFLPLPHLESKSTDEPAGNDNANVSTYLDRPGAPGQTTLHKTLRSNDIRNYSMQRMLHAQ